MLSPPVVANIFDARISCILQCFRYSPSFGKVSLERSEGNAHLNEPFMHPQPGLVDVGWFFPIGTYGSFPI